MECAPTAREAVVSLAMHEESSVPVPRLVVPSRNVTVPVGMPAGELNVAVRVTGWPKTLGLGDEAGDPGVGPVFTVCDNAYEVLRLRFVSPPHDAVMECAATARDA